MKARVQLQSVSSGEYIYILTNLYGLNKRSELIENCRHENKYYAANQTGRYSSARPPQKLYNHFVLHYSLMIVYSA